MVRNSNENQTVANSAANTEKVQNIQPKAEQQPKAELQQKNDQQPKYDQQPKNDQQRNRANNQNFNTKGQYQPRQQNAQRNADTQIALNKDAQSQNKDALRTGQNQSGPRNNNHGPRNHDSHNRDNGQTRGYYRDRNREVDKDAQLRQHTMPAFTRHQAVQRVKAEETIDDIKQDIIRLEKEIELEIKEIRSLKFL